MKQSDKSRSASSRKRSKKTEAQPPGSPPAAENRAIGVHSEVQALFGRAAELEGRLGELDQELRKASDEAGQSRARMAELEDQAGRSSRELQRAQEQAVKAEACAAELELRVGPLDQEVQRVREEASKANDRAAELERRSLELSAQASRAAGLEGRLGELDQELRKASDEAGQSRARMAELEDQAGRSSRELQRAQEQAVKAEARAAELELRVGPLDQEVQRVREEASKANDRAAELERRSLELSAQASRVAGLEGRLGELDQELRKASDEAGQSRARMAELENQTGRSSQDLQRAQEQAVKAEARAAELERRSLELSAQASRVAGLEEEAAALRRRIEETAKENDRLSAELNQAREIRETTQKETAQLKEQAAALHQQLQHSESRTSDANRRIESLQRDLAGAREFEARARESASQASLLRDTAERSRAEIERLKKTRVEQQRWLDELGQTVVDLERKLHDACSPSPTPRPEPAPPSTQVAATLEPPRPPTAPESGTPPTSPSEETTLRPQHLFGPIGGDGQPCYILLELLSRDAMGVVYRARERDTGRSFAVRFMAGQAGEERTAAIERQVEKLIALPHPNILHVQGSGRRKNRLYLATDLVDAPTLGRAKIREIPRAGAILRDVAAAVHYAHEEGIFHGDLNPENILVGREENRDHALVKDFAVGYLLETVVPAPSGKEARSVIRDPAYLPPEQAKEVKPTLDAAVDVYGLGATLYAALAGRPPFEGKDVAQVLSRVMIEEPLPLERVRPDVPEPLGAIVRRAMAKECRLRYASALEVADALTGFIEGQAAGPRS